MRAEHPVGAARPCERDLPDLLPAAGPLGHEDLAERAIGEEARVVVDPPIALGLPDDTDHVIGPEDALVDQLLQT